MEVVNVLLKYIEDKHNEYINNSTADLYDMFMDTATNSELDDYTLSSLFIKLAYQFSKDI